MTESFVNPPAFDSFRWNDWRSIGSGFYQLRTGARIHVFVDLRKADPFQLVPQEVANEALNSAVKMFKVVIDNEPTIFKLAAQKDIPDLLNQFRLKMNQYRPKGKQSKRVFKAQDEDEWTAAWKSIYFRHSDQCPIELQYEFDFATMGEVETNQLVIFLDSDLRFCGVALRGGFDPRN